MFKNRFVFLLCAACAALGAAYAQNDFAIGADISWVHERENNNVRYYHNGQRVDPFTILKEHGFNYIRLRLFVDPTATIPNESESPYSPAPAAYCGLDSTLKMAKRTKDAGMKFLLDFHYSDTWADPAKQYKPMSWQNLTTINQLAEKVRSYTKESLERFKDEDLLPDMVQIGNEAVGGMIWPEGRNYAVNGVGSWRNFATLVNAGINGVKDVDQNIKIMVHTINERNPGSWLTNLKNNLNQVESGAANKIDVIGLSYYSEWHGQPDSLERVVNRIADNHNIKISAVEYADNHRRVNDIIFNLPDDKGFGTFVWEPFDWRQVLFDWVSGTNSGRHSNARLQLYPQMAIDYGLNVSSSSSITSSSSSTTPSSSSDATTSIAANLKNLNELPQNAKVEVYNFQGKRVSNHQSLAKGVYLVKVDKQIFRMAVH
ncbi:MAG: glycosyl hydrolase 53 family protein [Fibromonadaceae bacterium]|jgi:arabinogalactan endo-1,4-beta-galactosidase|nr:glycosyl hydrolase 53 family protein [Fibromonadaceae bacterium]